MKEVRCMGMKEFVAKMGRRKSFLHLPSPHYQLIIPQKCSWRGQVWWKMLDWKCYNYCFQYGVVVTENYCCAMESYSLTLSN